MNTREEFRVDFEPVQEAEADGAPGKKKSPGFVRVLYDLMDSVKSAMLVVLIIFTFIFRPVGVEGGSMLPTFSDGDWVAVTAMADSYSRGDIVVITQPWKRHVPIIKRIIAVGGDTVDIDFDTGEVTVNGETLNESYINTATHLSYDVAFPLIVPQGKLFVMGDNRNDSLDSRSSQIGFIDERYVIGKAIIKLVPFSTERIR